MLTLPASDSAALQPVIHQLLRSQRIIVITGAGISCASGIPDFRSSDGLFAQLKAQHPDAKLSSGKDLFENTLYSNPQTTQLFLKMIAKLTQLSNDAHPTAFHNLLKDLDDAGKLQRVYTQNIDGLEAKAGLSYGLGSWQDSPPTPSKRKPAPKLNIPTAIPLHGSLHTMSCPKCNHSVPLPDHLTTLSQGIISPCPACCATNATRSAMGERLRPEGVLKVDVTLYGEPSGDEERIGMITEKDLMGRRRPDFLIVAGTSMKIPGVKRLVKELSKVIRPAPSSLSPPASSQESTSSASSSRSAPAKPKTLFLNNEFPNPAKDWSDCFDAWVQGDIQQFASAVTDYKAVLAKKAQEKEDRAALKSGTKPTLSGKAKPAVKRKRSVTPPSPTPVRIIPSAPRPSWALVPDSTKPKYADHFASVVLEEGSKRRRVATAKASAHQIPVTHPPSPPSLPLSRSSSISSSGCSSELLEWQEQTRTVFPISKKMNNYFKSSKQVLEAASRGEKC